MTTVPNKRDSRPRLPECMFCVHDHLAPGLPAGPPALLTRYARHAHDAGCGIWPGLRLLSRELRASPVTVRQWRDWLQERRLIQRLPRAGPHGTDLLRLGTCDDCRQRDSMQSRCERCQRDNLQHAEVEWWAAQRDFMESQKRKRRQVVLAAAATSAGSRPAAASPNGDGRHAGSAGSAAWPTGKQPSGTLRTLRASATTRSTTTRVTLTAAPAAEDRQQHNHATAAHGRRLRSLPGRSSDAGARAGATRTRSREPPGAPTGDPVRSPGDGRLFEYEPAAVGEYWR
jgi:hypothetical protein